MSGSSSSRGYHFYLLHKSCPMKFFLQYGLKIKPKKTAPALLNGQSFHLGKEVWYESQDRQKALDAIYDSLEDNRPEYADDDEYIKAFDRLPVMLETWIDKWGEFDKDNYKIIEIEMELEVPIKLTNFTHTMRLDAVVQRRGSKDVYILETKTTSFSLNSMVNTVTSGDQATAYIWGLKKMRPDLNVIGVVPDITYWHKSSKSRDKIVNHRAPTVIRSDRSLAEYEAGIAWEIDDISRKVKAVQEGKYPMQMLFQRYTSNCYSFFRQCPFYWICRDHDFNKPLPPDLEYDEREDIGLMSEAGQ